MDAATLAVICMLHAQDPAAHPLPADAIGCPAEPVRPAPLTPPGLAWLRPVVSTTWARDAMARTVIAEAGDQGDSGLAGVAYTILNRLADGRWGGTVETVVDAPGQFEPVMRAGGAWRGLPRVSEAQAVRVATIVDLAVDGRLPDLTGGARYFQNPQIIAARARAGTVSSARVNFGGATPSAVIGAHAFYVDRTGGSARRSGGRANSRADEIFVGHNHANAPGEGASITASATDSRRVPDDDEGIFVR